MATATAPKQADIRYRVEVKKLSGVVIYKVRSSADTDDYEVTLVNGKVSSCTCPAHRKNGVFCYIMRDVLAKEQEYQERQHQYERAASAVLSAEIAADVVTSEVTASAIETKTARIPAGTTIYRVDGQALFWEDLFSAWFCTCQEASDGSGVSYNGCEHSARMQAPAPGAAPTTHERIMRAPLNGNREFSLMR